jgi:hypothetical protein
VPPSRTVGKFVVKSKSANQRNQTIMPRGGVRPGAGRRKGTRSFQRTTIGKEAPPPDFRALMELRATAIGLRDLVIEERNKGRRANPETLTARYLAYAKVLEKIVPYEDYKLVSVAMNAAVVSRIEVVGGFDPEEEGIDEYAGSVEYVGAIVGDTAVALEHAASSIPGTAKTRPV